MVQLQGLECFGGLGLQPYPKGSMKEKHFAFLWPAQSVFGSWAARVCEASQFPVRTLSSSGQGLEGQVSVQGQPRGAEVASSEGQSMICLGFGEGRELKGYPGIIPGI